MISSMKRAAIIFLLCIGCVALIVFWTFSKGPRTQADKALSGSETALPATSDEKTDEKADTSRLDHRVPEDDIPEPFRETELVMAELRREGRYLLGKVVNLHDQPVPRARVTARASNGAPPFVAVTRDDGEFYIMAPRGSDYTIEVESAGLPVLVVKVPSK
jgi:hypothetical protein